MLLSHTLVIADHEKTCRDIPEGPRQYATDHWKGLIAIFEGTFTHVCHSGGVVPAKDAYRQWLREPEINLRLSEILADALYVILAGFARALQEPSNVIPFEPALKADVPTKKAA